MLTMMADGGDEDAVFVMEYEDQILDLVQELPELAQCFTAYSAERQRLRDRAKNRGFWPQECARATVFGRKDRQQIAGFVDSAATGAWNAPNATVPPPPSARPQRGVELCH